MEARLNGLISSVVAEQALLGTLMADNRHFEAVIGVLDEQDFYVRQNQWTYTAMVKLYGEGAEVSPITLRNRLPVKHHVELFRYLTSLFENAGYSQNVSNLIAVIKECRYRRDLAEASGQVMAAVDAEDVEALMAAQDKVVSITAKFSFRKPETPTEQMRETLEAGRDGKMLMKTGIFQLDKAIGGMTHNARYAIAGHAGVGKTAFALNIAWNMAKDGRKVRYLAFEGGKMGIWQRLLARECGVPITAFRHGLSEQQEAKVIEKQGEVVAHDFLVHANLPDLHTMITLCQGCDLIVVDGVSSAPAPSARNMIERVQVVSDLCKNLSEKTDAAVISLYHVNSETLKSKPSLTSLYGGQAATFDPEVILELRKQDLDAVGRHKVIEGHVLKNRYGSEGGVLNLNFDGEYMTYV